MAHSPVEPMTASHRIPSVPGPRRAPAATAPVLARAGGQFGRFADRRLWNRADRGPSSKSSPVSLAGIGDDDLRRSCDSFIPRMSVTAASAPNSTIGSGTSWDRAVGFRKGLVEGSGENQKPAQVPVPDRILPFPMIARRRNPALSGPRSRVRQSITEIGLKPSPELAARKIADIRPTALRDGQIPKARRILGRRSRVTNSKATRRSAGRCNLDRLKSSNRPVATCLELSFLALARSVIQASHPSALKRIDQGKRPQRR